MENTKGTVTISIDAYNELLTIKNGMMSSDRVVVVKHSPRRIVSYYTDNEVIKELGKELEESKNKYLELQSNHIGLINENFILNNEINELKEIGLIDFIIRKYFK